MNRKLIITSSFILSLLPAISAASMPFSGTYIGIDGGPAWASSRYQTNPNCPANTFAVFCDSTASSAANGTAVGNNGSGHFNLTRTNIDAHAGYNWVIQNYVIGGEAEFGSFNLGDTITTSGMFPVTFLGNAYTLSNSISTSWLGALRLRAGTMIREHFLIYAAGGLALTNLKLSSSYNDNAIGFGFPGGTGRNSASSIIPGWTLGAGGEWELNDNYSVQLEYLYVKFNQQDVNVSLTNTPTYRQTIKVSTNLQTNITRLGLNYSF